MDKVADLVIKYQKPIAYTTGVLAFSFVWFSIASLLLFSIGAILAIITYLVLERLDEFVVLVKDEPSEKGDEKSVD
jgi:hypothetical protein